VLKFKKQKENTAKLLPFPPVRPRSIILQQTRSHIIGPKLITASRIKPEMIP